MKNGEELKNFRLGLMEIQEDFAAKLGVTANYISLMENDAKPITPQILQKIADVYKQKFSIEISPKAN